MQLFSSARMSQGTSKSSNSRQASVARVSKLIAGLESGQAWVTPSVKPVRQYFPQGHLVMEKWPAFSNSGVLLMWPPFFLLSSLTSVLCLRQCTVEILHVESVAWVDGQASCAFLVLAELELSGSDVFAESPLRVLADVVRQFVAGSSGQEVAFAWMQSVSPPQQRKKTRKAKRFTYQSRHQIRT